MGRQTAIEWATATWNPWIGCTHVSPGCDHCYMFRDQHRYGNDPTQVRQTKTLRDPLKWAEPERVFTCSWSDFFHPHADAWRPAAWDVMRQAPHHIYLILTKRPQRIHRFLPPDWGVGWPHVWLGTSMEHKDCDYRRRYLRSLPAAVRFLSLEPLLGPIPLPPAMLRGIHWVIVGGESGPHHRPMEAAWVRQIRDDCQRAGVAFFFKQWGGRTPKAGGRVLDGRTWEDLPHAAARLG